VTTFILARDKRPVVFLQSERALLIYHDIQLGEARKI